MLKHLWNESRILLSFIIIIPDLSRLSRPTSTVPLFSVRMNFKSDSSINNISKPEIAPVTITDETSPYDVLNDQPKYRKLLLLIVFCFMVFLNTFNNSSLFAAIPPIVLQLNIPKAKVFGCSVLIRLHLLLSSLWYVHASTLNV